MKLGTCKLCVREKKLLRDSHIVPEFLYRKSGLYYQIHNPTHKFFLLDTGEELFNPELDQDQQGWLQKGNHESYIFCEECEDIIKKYEYYGKSILYEKVTCEDLVRSDGLRLISCSGIDYSKLKLFILSIFWRASISKKFVLEIISLDGYVSEKLRKMILVGDAGAPEEFPIVFQVAKIIENYPPDYVYIRPLTHIRYGGSNLTFFSDGYVFELYFSEKIKKAVLDDCLQSDGKLNIYYLPDNWMKTVLLKSIRTNDYFSDHHTFSNSNNVLELSSKWNVPEYFVLHDLEVLRGGGFLLGNIFENQVLYGC